MEPVRSFPPGHKHSMSPYPGQVHTLGVEKIYITEKVRLKWFGHLKMMDGRRLLRIIMEMPVKGIIILGRPRTRWLDEIKIDLKEKD